MAKLKSRIIKAQATIVITIMHDGTTVIISNNTGRDDAAKLADASAKLMHDIIAGAITAPPVPAETAGSAETAQEKR